jgi:TonB-linked SusC/RagA family outer membrane protein
MFNAKQETMHKNYTLVTRSYFSIIAIVLSAYGSINAQEKIVVRGTIRDLNDNAPMAYVTVAELDKDNRIVSGSTADLNGNYALKVSDSNNSIAFSFIGYKTIKEPIGNRTLINISLASEVSYLKTIQIEAARTKTASNGFMQMDARNLTTAVATIETKDLAEIQAVSIDQALQGRMAGVDIVANTGDPGSGMAIRIRGTSSINQSSDPLIIVDGMPYDTEVSSGFNYAAADEQSYAQLINIPPADIKDISILKDAAATAVWGSRASNGVIVINTRRGITGRPSVTYTYKGSVSKQPDPIPMLSGDQYSTLIPELYMNVNGRPLPSFIKEFQYDPGDPYNYYNYSNNTNWIDAITQLGSLNDHNLSLVGGGEKASYYTSIGYFNQKGTTIGTDLTRLNARVNLDFKVSDRIKFRTDIAYTYVDNDRSYNVSGRTDDPLNPRAIAYAKMPNMSIYEYDILGNKTPNYFSPAFNIQGQYPGTYNPVALVNHARNNVAGNRVRPTFYLQYEIIPQVLSTTFDVTFDINNDKITTFLPQVATGRPSTDLVVNRAEDSDNDKFIVQTKYNLIYSPVIKNTKHTLQTVFSAMTYDEKSVGYKAVTANTPSSYLQDPSVASRTQDSGLTLGSGISQNRSVGFILSAQYGFMDKYLVNGTIRRDGNSKFGENHRFGNFPSLSVRWRMSEEGFMKNFSFLDDLSLRASYGTSGNAPRDSYTQYSQYSNFSWNYLGESSIYPKELQLDNLRWETVIQSNFGLNYSFLQGKFSGYGEIYRKRTKDLFFRDLSIPGTTGFDVVDMNVGVMDNDGWEFSLSWLPYQKNDLSVRFDFNVSQNFNLIREISEYYPKRSGNINVNGEYLALLQINNPFGSFYGYRYKGVYKDEAATIARDENGNTVVDANETPIYMRFNYPVADYVFQPGDARYEDVNHDGNINYQDIVYLGNANPRFTGGFGPSITYKQLRLNVFFYFREGYDIINQTKINTEKMYNFDNQSTSVLRRWRKPGDETDIPRALFQYGYNWLGSDRFVEDGSFIRIKYITLRYDFKPEQMSRFHATQLGVYATLENLFTLTNYSGQDPEVSYKSGDPFSIGRDNAMTPPLRTFTLGLTVRF